MADQSVCKINGCNKPVYVKTRGWCRAHYLRWHRSGDPLAGGRMQAAPGEALVFIDRVAVPHSGEECLIWPYSRSKGEAMVYVDGKNARAARVVCEKAHGRAPSADHHAAHSCGQGRRGCVSAAHLRWATPSENNQDKLQHGTHNRGERHNLAKLTVACVREIRRLKGVESQGAIADRFGVSPAAIADIYARRSWAWLD